MRQIVELIAVLTCRAIAPIRETLILTRQDFFARPNTSVSCCSTLAISIDCPILTASSLCPRSSQIRISMPFCFETRRALRSYWRRMERHRELFNQYQRMCVVALSDGESPSIAGICSTDGSTSRLELIRRIELEGERLAWV